MKFFIISDRDLVVVEGINKVWKHVKASNDQPGRKFQKEAPIHISNVVFYDTEAQSRFKVGFRVDSEGNKVRYNKTTEIALILNGRKSPLFSNKTKNRYLKPYKFIGLTINLIYKSSIKKV